MLLLSSRWSWKDIFFGLGLEDCSDFCIGIASIAFDEVVKVVLFWDVAAIADVDEDVPPTDRTLLSNTRFSRSPSS